MGEAVTDSETGIDLSVDLAGVKLANPTLTASGTCGYGLEYGDFVELGRLGAFVTKSITLEPRAGNDAERIVETRAGMLNAIGLANVGLDRFLAEKVPDLKQLGVPVFVNVAGKTIASVYSVRPRPGAPVSTPLLWDELERVTPDDFTIATLWERLSRYGDLFAPVLRAGQRLEAAEAGLGL